MQATEDVRPYVEVRKYKRICNKNLIAAALSFRGSLYDGKGVRTKVDKVTLK